MAISAVGAIQTAKAGRRNIRMAREEADRAREERERQQALLNEEMDRYKAQEFKNPYAENVFEDLTVNQRQAQFQAEQGGQIRANLLSNLRTTAGGSGIAALAQALANQGQLQTKEISLGIGEQESFNQRMMAQGQLNVQRGEELLQGLNIDRQSTLLGMQFGQTTGANENFAQMQENLIGARTSAAQANAQAWQNLANTAVETDWSQLQKKPPNNQGSDRRLKKNINLIGQSPSGLNIYSFEYKNSMYGKGLFQGVMSDEVPSIAVVKGVDGYDMVDYNMLDVQFKQI